MEIKFNSYENTMKEHLAEKHVLWLANQATDQEVIVQPTRKNHVIWFFVKPTVKISN